MFKSKIKLYAVICFILFAIPLISACSFDRSSKAEESDESVTFNFGSMDGPEHVQNKYTFPYFSEQVEKLTNGRVDFRMYMGGSLGGSDETLDNITTGLMDVGRGIHGYNAGRYKAQSVLNLPFLADGNSEELSIVAQKLYEEFPEIRDEYQDVKPLWIHAADPYAIITKDKAVRSLDDVKGLKLRTPSDEGSKMIKSWGATPVSLGAPEVYDAMQKGTIDGGILPVAAIKDFNLSDVIDYVTIGYFNTNLFYVSMNEDSWDRFRPEEKDLLEDDLIGKPMAKKAGQVFDEQKEKGEEEAKEAGVEFIELPDEETEKFKKASENVSKEWIKDMEDQGIDGQKIYDEAERLINELDEE